MASDASQSVEVEPSMVVGNSEDAPVEKRLLIPSGAEAIVRFIAAQRIMELMLLRYKLNGSFQHLEYDALMDLVSEFPGVCQRTYSVVMADGQVSDVFPLIVLLHLQPPLALVEKVFEAHPEAIFQRYGYRPMDICCEMNASLEVVKFLHFSNPKIVGTALRDGRYPLHVALSFFRACSSQSRNDTATDVIKFLLETYPEAVCKRDRRGHFPLHHAAFGGAPLSLVKRIYAMFPEAADATDDKNWTSLHYACRYGKSNHRNSDNDNNLAVLSFLVDVAPAALGVRNQAGWTPVMTAASYQTANALKLLLDNHPNLAGENEDRTLLILATKHNTANVVDLISHRFPWLLTTQGSLGMPLHYACKRRESEAEILDIVKVLLSHDRQAIITIDRHGKLPLNWAYHVHGMDSKVTELLMRETAKGA